MKTIDTNKIAAAAMQELVDHAQKNAGTVKELADTLTKLTGKKVHRQMIGEWLNPDPTKRSKPTLGTGLLLLDEGAKLMKKPRTIDLAKIVGKGKPMPDVPLAYIASVQEPNGDIGHVFERTIKQ